MNQEILAAIALFVFVLSLISRKLEKSIVTPTMAYTKSCSQKLLMYSPLNSPSLGDFNTFTLSIECNFYQSNLVLRQF